MASTIGERIFTRKHYSVELKTRTERKTKFPLSSVENIIWWKCFYNMALRDSLTGFRYSITVIVSANENSVQYTQKREYSSTVQVIRMECYSEKKLQITYCLRIPMFVPCRTSARTILSAAGMNETGLE